MSKLPLLFLSCAFFSILSADPTPGTGTGSAPGDSATARKDSVAAQPDSIPQKRLYDYIANPALQIVTWPADVVLVPAVKLAIYPFKAPLRYLLNENVIDRTIQLISFGPNDRIMLYPTMNLAPGTGSTTGLTFRHMALFGRPNEKLVARGNVYVNGDWRFRSYLTAGDMLGSGFDSKSTIQFTRMKNVSVNQPGTNAFWYYSDTSNVFSLSVGHPLVEQLGGKATFMYRDNHFGLSPGGDDPLLSGFFRDGVPEAAGRPDSIEVYLKSRGLDKNWSDRILVLGLYRDTRNNENITLSGSDLHLDWHYHFTSAGHDFNAWQAEWTGFYKLGKEQYEISAAEERKAGRMNIKKILAKMEYQKLRKELFNRKVLAIHLYSAQSYEVSGNRMPVYGLNTLGNDTPLRGYAGSRFRDYTVLSLGSEYRFPVMRLVDGVIFNEYGVYGRSWEDINYLENLKNSWGFGIRVRRPDISLFRVQLGFHGLHGIEFNMSVDSPY